MKRDATPEEVKRAYRKLAAEVHPDKNPGDPKAETRFKSVNRAYQVLGDKAKRALYDEFGEEGLREGFNSEAARAYRRGWGVGAPGGAGSFRMEDLFSGSGGGGIGDFMSDLFSGGRQGTRRRGRAKGADIASEVGVDFATAIRGTTVKVRLHDGANEVTVRIPPGAADGDKVRVAGQGAPGLGGGVAGDLIIAIRVDKHPYFERDGLDLYLDLPITLGEAYRGAKVKVPTPTGDVTLKVPKHAQSGQVVRLKGRGVERKGQQGDLFVRFLVRLPESESKALDEAVSAFEEATTEDVRAGISF